MGESSLELKPGQRFTRRQMLYGMMLKSANDVAHALGRDNAGSIEAFAEKMNQRARGIGRAKYAFRQPKRPPRPRPLHHAARSRLDRTCGHAAALFRKIVGTREYGWTVNGAVNPLHNHNHLLERFPGCTGVKTGYTYPSQQVLVSSAIRTTAK